LTLGLTLGSWWAYRELGWGGWWFWDPVENASFMPWLMGTALIHSLMVSEKRHQFVAWTILLSIGAFSLSLIGTFLVRSGVLTSVHAFAVDPLRGTAILLFLLVVIGGSLGLFAFRSHTLSPAVQPHIVSRESALLLNSVLLAVAMLSVLLGTIYPLLIDGLGLGKLSVGAPYFNSVFTALMMPLFLIMGVGIHLHWQTDAWSRVLQRVGWVLVVSLVLPLAAYALGPMSMTIYLGLVSGCWIVLSTMVALCQRVHAFGVQKGLSQAYLGMVLAHVGVGVTVLGVSVSSGYGIQEDVKWAPHETIQFAHKTLTFISETPLRGPNYHGTRARIDIRDGQHITSIYPEKRIYDVTHMPMTDAAIDVNPWRDVYIALGEPLGDTAWSVRLYDKPLVRWIWGGGFLMLLGGFFALTDRRYFRSEVGA
jgi:cytochrome c-type biogenesis protein CcmF